MVKTRVIRFLRLIEGRNARDQIELCAFHSLLVEVQANAGYIHATQCVITTSRLGWRVPLVARNNYVKKKPLPGVVFGPAHKLPGIERT